MVKKIIVVSVDLVAALLHLIFQVHLSSEFGTYAKFTLMENILIATIFAIFAVCMIRSKFETVIVGIHWIFMSVFLCGMIIIRPQHTTLDIFGDLIGIEQWIIWCTFGLFVWIVNGLLYVDKKKKII